MLSMTFKGVSHLGTKQSFNAFHSRTLVFWLTEYLQGSNEINVYERKYELSIVHTYYTIIIVSGGKNQLLEIYISGDLELKKKLSEFWKKSCGLEKSRFA